MPRSSGVNLLGGTNTWTGGNTFSGVLTQSAIARMNASMQVNPIRAKAVTYLMLTGDFGVYATAGAGGISITLPAAPGGGQLAFVKRVDSGAGTVTVLPGTGTLDGAASVSLTTLNQSVLCQFDGANWWVIGQVATTIL